MERHPQPGGTAGTAGEGPERLLHHPGAKEPREIDLNLCSARTVTSKEATIAAGHWRRIEASSLQGTIRGRGRRPVVVTGKAFSRPAYGAFLGDALVGAGARTRFGAGRPQKERPDGSPSDGLSANVPHSEDELRTLQLPRGVGRGSSRSSSRWPPAGTSAPISVSPRQGRRGSSSHGAADRASEEDRPPPGSRTGSLRDSQLRPTAG